MAYTIIGQPFEDFVKMRTAVRNQKVAVDREMMVEVDETIMKAFSESTSASSK